MGTRTAHSARPSDIVGSPKSKQQAISDEDFNAALEAAKAAAKIESLQANGGVGGGSNLLGDFPDLAGIPNRLPAPKDVLQGIAAETPGALVQSGGTYVGSQIGAGVGSAIGAAFPPAAPVSVPVMTAIGGAVGAGVTGLLNPKISNIFRGYMDLPKRDLDLMMDVAVPSAIPFASTLYGATRAVSTIGKVKPAIDAATKGMSEAGAGYIKNTVGPMVEDAVKMGFVGEHNVNNFISAFPRMLRSAQTMMTYGMPAELAMAEAMSNEAVVLNTVDRIVDMRNSFKGPGIDKVVGLSEAVNNRFNYLGDNVQQSWQDVFKISKDIGLTDTSKAREALLELGNINLPAGSIESLKGFKNDLFTLTNSLVDREVSQTTKTGPFGESVSVNINKEIPKGRSIQDIVTLRRQWQKQAYDINTSGPAKDLYIKGEKILRDMIEMPYLTEKIAPIDPVAANKVIQANSMFSKEVDFLRDSMSRLNKMPADAYSAIETLASNASNLEGLLPIIKKSYPDTFAALQRQYVDNLVGDIYSNPGGFTVEKIKDIQSKLSGKTANVKNLEVAPGESAYNKTQFIGEQLLGKEKLGELGGFLSDLKTIESFGKDSKMVESSVFKKLSNRIVGYILRNPIADPTIIEKLPIDPELSRKMIRTINEMNPEIAANSVTSIPHAQEVRRSLVKAGIDPFMFDSKVKNLMQARANLQSHVASNAVAIARGASMPFIQPSSMAPQAPTPGQSVDVNIPNE